MYNNKQLLKITKSLVQFPQTNEIFLQNLNLSKTQGLLNFIENSIFWSAKRFKFLQSFSTNVQHIERRDNHSFTFRENKEISTTDFNSLFLLFNSVLNSRCSSNSLVNYYNFSTTKKISKKQLVFITSLKSTRLKSFIESNLQNSLFFFNSSFLINYHQKTQKVSLDRNIFNIFTDNDSSAFTKVLHQKKKKTLGNYIVSLADQLVFTTGYNSLFLSYIGNSILMDKQSMRVFNNIKKF